MKKIIKDTVVAVLLPFAAFISVLAQLLSAFSWILLFRTDRAKHCLKNLNDVIQL